MLLVATGCMIRSSSERPCGSNAANARVDRMRGRRGAPQLGVPFRCTSDLIEARIEKTKRSTRPESSALGQAERLEPRGAHEI
jgi:hypothetical protein